MSTGEVTKIHFCFCFLFHTMDRQTGALLGFLFVLLNPTMAGRNYAEIVFVSGSSTETGQRP